MKQSLHYNFFTLCLAVLASTVLWRAAESAGGYGALPVCEIRGTIADVKTVKTAPLPSPCMSATATGALR